MQTMQAMDVRAAREELMRAVHDMSQRCLHQGGKWAAEQLVALERTAPSAGDSCDASTSAPQFEEDAHFILGKSLLDCQEYLRASHVLSRAKRTPTSVFLRHYATYLHLTRSFGVASPASVPTPAGRRLMEGLRALLRDVLHDMGFTTAEAAAKGTAYPWGKRDGSPGDPFLAYLAGMVLSDLQQRDLARSALAASVRWYPCLQPSWRALQPLCRPLPGDPAPPQAADAAGRGIPAGVLIPDGMPDHWATRMFEASLLTELHHPAAAVEVVRGLRGGPLGQSTTVDLLEASALYGHRAYEQAQEIFERLFDREPAMLEGADVYSNIMYVNDDLPRLSALARRMMEIDRYRPESNCVVGNFFSARREHAKAIQYFDRAVRLDKNYLSAWTLIGHEFVELKNTSAAIQAYRKAVDINPSDFRAWYGLGQTYEMLMRPHFALYYYKQAAKIRPQDARMWTAVGSCYQSASIAQTADAIRAFRKAVSLGDQDGVALDRLAELYQESGQLAQATVYYKALLDASGGAVTEDAGTVRAAFFLAEQAQSRGDVGEVERLMLPFLDTGGRDRERAKALLRAARAMPVTAAPAVLPDEGIGGGSDSASDISLVEDSD